MIVIENTATSNATEKEAIRVLDATFAWYYSDCVYFARRLTGSELALTVPYRGDYALFNAEGKLAKIRKTPLAVAQWVRKRGAILQWMH